MVLIRELVQQALETGYLTVATEDRLRQLLTTHYDQEDLNAFITLQLAAMSGQVKQEARELRQAKHNCCETQLPQQLCYETQLLNKVGYAPCSAENLPAPLTGGVADIAHDSNSIEPISNTVSGTVCGIPHALYLMPEIVSEYNFS